MAAPYRSRTVCFCADRLLAMQSQTFRFSHQLGGWYWHDAPTRSAKFNAPKDNDGFPYAHTICDFCGHPLPGARFPDEDAASPQGDGNPGSEGGE